VPKTSEIRMISFSAPGAASIVARALAVSSAALWLSGCASGPAPPKPPAYADWSRPARVHAARPARVLIPRPGSPEYLRSWGVRQVNPEPAFRAGFTGRGVTIAVIDTGLVWAQPEVARQADAASTDLNPGRTGDSRLSNHGGEISGAIAAALDGGGLVGVAYGASLLSIRADLDGSCMSECAFRTADLARGVDYALQHGARIMVLAVEGPHRLSPRFEAALERATAAGAVIVIAAGNEMAADPTWPARYAADPRFAHSVIAVGATAPDGALARWSNRAGTTRARYLAAPGERLLANCDDKVCSLVSGTSFSAPYVAGGLALLMESRPELSAQEAADLLLQAARSPKAGGAPDPRFGRGVLDIGRAFEAARRWRPVVAAAPGGAGG
jgi:subtilisin family serine protease